MLTQHPPTPTCVIIALSRWRRSTSEWVWWSQRCLSTSCLPEWPTARWGRLAWRSLGDICLHAPTTARPDSVCGCWEREGGRAPSCPRTRLPAALSFCLCWYSDDDGLWDVYMKHRPLWNVHYVCFIIFIVGTCVIMTTYAHIWICYRTTLYLWVCLLTLSCLCTVRMHTCTYWVI